MNRNSWIAAAIVVVLIILGIFMFRSRDEVRNDQATAGTEIAGPTTVRPYGEVGLRIGETALFRGLSLRPVAVIEDSRCPQDVQCIQAGTVRVEVESSTSGAATRKTTVGLNATSTIDTFSVSLTRVEPAARAGSTIPSSDYRFTFQVRQSAVSDSELIGK